MYSDEAIRNNRNKRNYYFQIFNISYVVSGKMFREILSYEQQYHQRNGNNELNELLLYKRPN